MVSYTAVVKCLKQVKTVNISRLQAQPLIRVFSFLKYFRLCIRLHIPVEASQVKRYGIVAVIIKTLITGCKDVF